MEPMIALSAETFFMLKKFAKSELIEGRQVTLSRGKAQSE